MERNKLIYLGVFLGSTIGGFIPSLWGAGFASMSGVIFTAVGGFFGIYIGFKLSN